MLYKSQKLRTVKIGGSTNKIDITHITLCAEKLGLIRIIKGHKYHLYAAGTSDWADHLANKLRNGKEKGVEVVVVKFADPALCYKAVYVRIHGRK